MNEFNFLAELDRSHEHRADLATMADRMAGTPYSPLHKRQTFADRELAALVATATSPE